MNEPVKSPVISRTLPSRNEFDEEAYLQLNPDVSEAVSAGVVGSGWQHFTLHGFTEGRRWMPKADPLIGVSRDIAPGDEMNSGNDDHYFDVGESALHCVETALFTARKPRSSVTKILDLPCGCGRVMRFLKKAFPDAQLTACDLNQGGIEFCARTFGAASVLSRENAEEIPFREKFDLIWCGSLLTHLSEKKCASFFQLFQRLLHPGGILVVTMHGRRSEIELTAGTHQYGLDDRQSAQLLKEYRRAGFGFVEYSPNSGYGISLASPSFVTANFVQVLEWRMLGYHEAGWDKRQDVICLQRMGSGVGLAGQDAQSQPNG